MPEPTMGQPLLARSSFMDRSARRRETAAHTKPSKAVVCSWADVWQHYGSPTEHTASSVSPTKHPASSTADALVHVVVKSRDTASQPNVGGSKVVCVAARPVAAADSDTTAAAAAAARRRLIRKLDIKLRTLVKAAPAPSPAADDHVQAGDSNRVTAPDDCRCAACPLLPAALQHRPAAAGILRQTTTLLKKLLRRRNKRSSGCSSSDSVSSASGKASTESTACPAAAAVPQVAAAATEQPADAQAASSLAVPAAQQGAVRAPSEVAAVALLPSGTRQAASLPLTIPVPPAAKAAEGAAASGICGEDKDLEETPDSLQLRPLTPLAGFLAWQHMYQAHREQLACWQRMRAAAAASCHHPVIWGFDVSAAVMVAA